MNRRELMAGIAHSIAGLAAVVVGVQVARPQTPSEITLKINGDAVVEAFIRDYKNNGRTRQIISERFNGD